MDYSALGAAIRAVQTKKNVRESITLLRSAAEAYGPGVRGTAPTAALPAAGPSPPLGTGRRGTSSFLGTPRSSLAGSSTNSDAATGHSTGSEFGFNRASQPPSFMSTPAVPHSQRWRNRRHYRSSLARLHRGEANTRSTLKAMPSQGAIAKAAAQVFSRDVTEKFSIAELEAALAGGGSYATSAPGMMLDDALELLRHLDIEAQPRAPLSPAGSSSSSSSIVRQTGDQTSSSTKQRIVIDPSGNVSTAAEHLHPSLAGSGEVLVQRWRPNEITDTAKKWVALERTAVAHNELSDSVTHHVRAALHFLIRSRLIGRAVFLYHLLCDVGLHLQRVDVKLLLGNLMYDRANTTGDPPSTDAFRDGSEINREWHARHGWRIGGQMQRLAAASAIVSKDAATPESATALVDTRVEDVDLAVPLVAVPELSKWIKYEKAVGNIDAFDFDEDETVVAAQEQERRSAAATDSRGKGQPSMTSSKAAVATALHVSQRRILGSARQLCHLGAWEVALGLLAAYQPSHFMSTREHMLASHEAIVSCLVAGGSWSGALHFVRMQKRQLGAMAEREYLELGTTRHAAEIPEAVTANDYVWSVTTDYVGHRLQERVIAVVLAAFVQLPPRRRFAANKTADTFTAWWEQRLRDEAVAVESGAPQSLRLNPNKSPTLLPLAAVQTTTSWISALELLTPRGAFGTIHPVTATTRTQTLLIVAMRLLRIPHATVTFEHNAVFVASECIRLAVHERLSLHQRPPGGVLRLTTPNLTNDVTAALDAAILGVIRSLGLRHFGCDAVRLLTKFVRNLRPGPMQTWRQLVETAEFLFVQCDRSPRNAGAVSLRFKDAIARDLAAGFTSLFDWPSASFNAPSTAALRFYAASSDDKWLRRVALRCGLRVLRDCLDALGDLHEKMSSERSSRAQHASLLVAHDDLFSDTCRVLKALIRIVIVGVGNEGVERSATVWDVPREATKPLVGTRFRSRPAAADRGAGVVTADSKVLPLTAMERHKLRVAMREVWSLPAGSRERLNGNSRAAKTLVEHFPQALRLAAQRVLRCKQRVGSRQAARVISTSEGAGSLAALELQVGHQGGVLRALPSRSLRPKQDHNIFELNIANQRTRVVRPPSFEPNSPSPIHHCDPDCHPATHESERLALEIVRGSLRRALYDSTAFSHLIVAAMRSPPSRQPTGAPTQGYPMTWSDALTLFSVALSRYHAYPKRVTNSAPTAVPAQPRNACLTYDAFGEAINVVSRGHSDPWLHAIGLFWAAVDHGVTPHHVNAAAVGSNDANEVASYLRAPLAAALRKSGKSDFIDLLRSTAVTTRSATSSASAKVTVNDDAVSTLTALLNDEDAQLQQHRPVNSPNDATSSRAAADGGSAFRAAAAQSVSWITFADLDAINANVARWRRDAATASTAATTSPAAPIINPHFNAKWRRNAPASAEPKEAAANVTTGAWWVTALAHLASKRPPTIRNDGAATHPTVQQLETTALRLLTAVGIAASWDVAARHFFACVPRSVDAAESGATALHSAAAWTALMNITMRKTSSALGRALCRVRKEQRQRAAAADRGWDAYCDQVLMRHLLPSRGDSLWREALSVVIDSLLRSAPPAVVAGVSLQDSATWLPVVRSITLDPHQKSLIPAAIKACAKKRRWQEAIFFYSLFTAGPASAGEGASPPSLGALSNHDDASVEPMRRALVQIALMCGKVGVDVCAMIDAESGADQSVASPPATLEVDERTSQQSFGVARSIAAV